MATMAIVVKSTFKANFSGNKYGNDRKQLWQSLLNQRSYNLKEE